MKAQEKLTSKRYIKTLTFVNAVETDRATLYTFVDDEEIQWSHYQIPPAEAMKYGGMKAYSKAVKFIKAMNNKKTGDKIKCACVIRRMNDDAYSEKDLKPHIYGNVEEIIC